MVEESVIAAMHEAAFAIRNGYRLKQDAREVIAQWIERETTYATPTSDVQRVVHALTIQGT